MQLTITGFLFLILLTVTTSLSAQKLNVIPNADIRNFNDGWHQFEADLVTFDVEILQGVLKQGTIIWPDKSIYEGYLNGPVISGRGTYKWPNGIRYEGKFANNMRHGKGSFILQNNIKWYGKWQDNKKHGKGRIYDADGKLIRKGVWENGLEVK